MAAALLTQLELHFDPLATGNAPADVRPIPRTISGTSAISLMQQMALRVIDGEISDWFMVSFSLL
jgi:hypothetical protein